MAVAPLTDAHFLSKVKQLGREARNNSWFATAHFLRGLRWEMVQSVAHLTLTQVI